MEAGPQPEAAPGDLLPENPLLPDNPLLPSNPLEEPKTADADGQSEESTMSELPQDLADLFNTFQVDREQQTPSGPPPPTIEQIELDRAADANIAPDVVLRPKESINMRQALSTPMWLNVTNDAGYPLNDLLLFMSHYTGVPIEVEWVAFDIVGQPINAPVKLPSRLMPVEEVLKGICESVGAEFEVKEHAIVVRPSTDMYESAVLDALRLEDLGEQGVAAADIARTLLRMEPANSAELEVPTELGRQQLAVLVCEAIRMSRGVPTKMRAEALARWAGDYESQLGGWQPVAGGVSGPRRVQPASFGSLIRGTARKNSVTCFIRWQDAALSQLTPIDKQMPHTGDDVSAEQMLAQVLEPHGLVARIVDEGHWWIGSQASFDRFPVVVWFPDSAQDPKKRVDRINAILASAGDDASVGVVTVDPASGWCLAVLPRYLLRQVPRVLGDTVVVGE